MVFALCLVGAVGAGVFFLGGFYDVAASEQDPALVSLALIHVRQASIERHADAPVPAGLYAPARVRDGVQTYRTLGCQDCHGGLGAPPARFSEGLNPPPNLKAVIGDITPAQLFWVLKYGIKMSAMPSFGTGRQPAPDADLWDVVAFLKQVPSLSPDDLGAWYAAHPATGTSPETGASVPSGASQTGAGAHG